MEKLLRGQDCLLVAPTRHGKSFMFEAMPFATSYIRMKKEKTEKKEKTDDCKTMVLVISPLISLMKL
jgi:superfamily II DNA helicase RecQ